MSVTNLTPSPGSLILLDNKHSLTYYLSIDGVLIKLVVDIKQEILAGGGTLHSDCEDVSLEHGSQQSDLWGADWIPDLREIIFESLINIHPNQNNLDLKFGLPSAVPPPALVHPSQPHHLS